MAVWLAAMSLKRFRRPSPATPSHRLSPGTSHLIELSSLGQSNGVSKWQDTEEDHLWQQLQGNPAPLASPPVPRRSTGPYQSNSLPLKDDNVANGPTLKDSFTSSQKMSHGSHYDGWQTRRDRPCFHFHFKSTWLEDWYPSALRL